MHLTIPRFSFLRASLVAQMVKNLHAMQETWVQSLGWKISWRREQLPTPVFLPGEFHGQRSWQVTVHGVSKSWTREATVTFTFHFFTVMNSRRTQLFYFTFPSLQYHGWFQLGCPGFLFLFGLSSWASSQWGSLRILRKAWVEAARALEIRDQG